MFRTARFSALSSILLLCSAGLLLATGCSDEVPSTPDTTSSPDLSADSTEEVSVDADVLEETSEDMVDEEAEEEVIEEVCPDSISCWDPDRERPRAAICSAEGFPTGTACIQVSGGGDACCVPPFSCETDQDCEDSREAEGFCLDDRFACVCNTTDGSCSSFVCADNDECGDEEVCQNGQCVADEVPSGLEARIVTRNGVITEGETRQLEAVGVDPETPEHVFLDVEIDWDIESGDSVSLSDDGEVTGGTGAGVTTVVARVAGNDSDPGDRLELQNYDDVSEEGVRVVVVNENTHSPVQGAWLWVEPTDSDAFAHEMSSNDEVITIPTDGPVSITVVHDDYSYLTFAYFDGDELLVALPPVGNAKVTPADEEGSEERHCVDPESSTDESLCYELEGVAAVTGLPEFDVLPNVGEVDVAITGFALGNSLLDLNFELIVGPNIDRDISNGPVPVDDLAEIPGGVSLQFNEEPLVPHYVVTGLPGTQAMWTLGGRVSLSDNPTLLPDILEQIDGDLQIGQIIAVVLPLFSDFYSGIDADIELEVTDGLDLYEVDAPLSVPMARRVFINAPHIPEASDAPLETALFLPGAMVPGRGFIPLGITAAVDNGNGTEMDGVLDGDTETEEIDAIPLNMAPIHSGINSPSTQYVLVSLALSLEEPGDTRRRENTVGNIIRYAPGEAIPNQVDYPQDDFPSLPEGSTYAADTRLVTINPVEGQEIGFYRVLFKADNGRTWQVHLPPTELEYTIPNPSTEDLPGFSDRTEKLKVSIITVALQAEGDVDYEALLTPGGATFLELVNYVTEFAILEIGD